METPICDFVKEYADNGFSRFHMPGHKGRKFIGCEKYDITEIDGADVLSHADGIIKKSQENAAKLFGSGASFYSTEGSSQCIKTMLAVVFADYRRKLMYEKTDKPENLSEAKKTDKPEKLCEAPKTDKAGKPCEAQKKDRQEKLCENQNTDAMPFYENEIIEKSGAITERAYVLAARNVHKSMIDALALLDLDVEFIYPKDADSICVSMVTPADIMEYLEKVSDNTEIKTEEIKKILDNAQRDDMKLSDTEQKNICGKENKRNTLPMAVYITSPDYLGNTADIEGISKVCEKYDIPLIVDNAHGAYQAFLDEEKYGNIHPIKSGAAICCDSAHKTLPVLTGGAYIHVSRKYKERFAPYVASYMTMFGSTSPSYLIMQSLDMCNRYIDEKIRHELNDCIGRIEKTKKVLAENNVKLMEAEPLKIVIDTAAAGMEGEEVAEEIRKYKIECEYADKYFVVLMITPQNDEKDFERLEKWAVETKYKRVSKKKIEPKKLILHRAERVMSIREAAFSPYRKIKVYDACGSICASQTIACPPAIPIAVCGERIDQNMISIFEEYGIDYVNVVSY